LKPYSDGPDISLSERLFCPTKFPLFQGWRLQVAMGCSWLVFHVWKDKDGEPRQWSLTGHKRTLQKANKQGASIASFRGQLQRERLFFQELEDEVRRSVAFEWLMGAPRPSSSSTHGEKEH
jgi:hypothetical protein